MARQTSISPDPDVITVDPSFNGLATERAHPASVDRRAVGRGAGLERQGRYLLWSDIPNNRQMRWIEDDGHVQRLPHAVEQQQRQHLRLPGPPDLLRASDPARGPLRARRLDHRARRLLRTASGSTRPTTSFPIRTAASGSPTRPTAASSTRAPRRAWRPSNAAGRINPKLGQPAGIRHQAGAADPSLSVGSERQARPGGHRGAGAGPERPLLLARLQEAVRRQHGQGSWRHREGGKGDIFVLDVGSDNKLANQKAVHRLHGRRRQLRPRRRALRRLRQPLGLEQCRPRRRLQRRDRLEPGRPSCSAASACPRSAATSASAAPSATGCSWPAASRSTPSTPPPRGRRPADRAAHVGLRARQGGALGALPLCQCTTPA